jgi:hypothetical protein
MSDFNTQADNTIFGGYGEFDNFDVTADWTAADWAAHDADVAAALDAHDAEQERINFYWETEAEVRLAYYDEPDLPF